MLCIVVAVSLLFVATLANTEELQDEAFQKMRLALNGSVAINNWPLQLDWIESSLAVENEHQRLVNQLFDESEPIIAAKYFQLSEYKLSRQPLMKTEQELKIINKVIVVDELVIWKLKKLSFRNVTIIARLAVFEEVRTLEDCLVVAEHLKISALTVTSNTFFANRLHFSRMSSFFENSVVSNNLILNTSSLANYEELNKNLSGNQFLSTVIDLVNTDGKNSPYSIELNTFLFSNLTFNDRWCIFTRNNLHGHVATIKGATNFFENTLELVDFVVLGLLNNFTGKNIKTESSITSLLPSYLANLSSTNRVIIRQNLTSYQPTFRVIETVNKLVPLKINFIQITNPELLKEMNNLLNSKVEYFWLTVPVLLAQLMPSTGGLFGAQSESIPSYLPSESTKMLLRVTFSFNKHVLYLIKTHMTATYNNMTTRESKLSQNNSSALVKFFRLDLLPIHLIFQYRAQDVLASDTKDGFFKVDTINFYTTGTLTVQNINLVANTVNFYYGLTTVDSLLLKNVTIIAGNVNFKTFQHSGVTLQEVLIVAWKVHFTTKNIIYDKADTFNSSYILADSITFAEAAVDSHEGEITLIVQNSVFIADSLKLICFGAKLLDNLISANRTFVINCKGCSVQRNLIFAKHATLENFSGEVENTQNAWRSNSLFLQRFSVHQSKVVTLRKLTLAAEVVEISCFDSVLSNVYVSNKLVKVCSHDFMLSNGSVTGANYWSTVFKLKRSSELGAGNNTISLINCTYSGIKVSTWHSVYGLFSVLMSFFTSLSDRISCKSVSSYAEIVGLVAGQQLPHLENLLDLLQKRKTFGTSQAHKNSEIHIGKTESLPPTSASNNDQDNEDDEKNEESNEEWIDYDANSHEDITIRIAKFTTASVRRAVKFPKKREFKRQEKRGKDFSLKDRLVLLSLVFGSIIGATLLFGTVMLLLNKSGRI